MKKIKNYPISVDVELPEADRLLLQKLDTFCISDVEKEFLSNMLEIEQHWFTEIGAPIILEHENNDKIYIIHRYSNEYEIGDSEQEHVYVALSLSELLSLYLDDCGIVNRHVSVLEWLRERNYENVRYDRTYDKM